MKKEKYKRRFIEDDTNLNINMEEVIKKRKHGKKEVKKEKDSSKRKT